MKPLNTIDFTKKYKFEVTNPWESKSGMLGQVGEMSAVTKKGIWLDLDELGEWFFEWEEIKLLNPKAL